jgi:hypothetical protein
MVDKLEDEEDRFKDALLPFLRNMFKRFYEHREVFSRAI